MCPLVCLVGKEGVTDILRCNCPPYRLVLLQHRCAIDRDTGDRDPLWYFVAKQLADGGSGRCDTLLKRVLARDAADRSAAGQRLC